MARTKSNTTASTEKIKTVEVKETSVENAEETKIEETPVTNTEETSTNKTEKKAKKFGDDDDVKIKCLSLAGKSVVTTDPKNPVSFDEKGIGTVKGIVAKKLITIPGYELA